MVSEVRNGTKQTKLTKEIEMKTIENLNGRIVELREQAKDEARMLKRVLYTQIKGYMKPSEMEKFELSTNCWFKTRDEYNFEASDYTTIRRITFDVELKYNNSRLSFGADYSCEFGLDVNIGGIPCGRVSQDDKDVMNQKIKMLGRILDDENIFCSNMEYILQKEQPHREIQREISQCEEQIKEIQREERYQERLAKETEFDLLLKEGAVIVLDSPSNYNNHLPYRKMQYRVLKMTTKTITIMAGYERRLKIEMLRDGYACGDVSFMTEEEYQAHIEELENR